MAITVIPLALLHVKIVHVIYKMDHVLSVSMEFMVIIVTYHVPSTVKTTNAKSWMEHAFPVNLDGLECTVKEVRKRIVQCVYKKPWLYVLSSYLSFLFCFMFFGQNISLKLISYKVRIYFLKKKYVIIAFLTYIYVMIYSYLQCNLYHNNTSNVFLYLYYQFI